MSWGRLKGPREMLLHIGCSWTSPPMQDMSEASSTSSRQLQAARRSSSLGRLPRPAGSALSLLKDACSFTRLVQLHIDSGKATRALSAHEATPVKSLNVCQIAVYVCTHHMWLGALICCRHL